jgi:hypothetical protein
MVCRWRTTITMTWCPVIGITPGRLFAAFPQHQYPFWKRWCPERCLEYRIESHILDPSLDSYDWVTYYCIASSMAHSSGICYWLAHINASLQCIADDNFCANNKSDWYAPGSFFRSLILALLEWGPRRPFPQCWGFYLAPGDVHSQLLDLDLIDCQRLLLWSTHYSLLTTRHGKTIVCVIRWQRDLSV